MRLLLAHALVIVIFTSSVGAESRLNNSESKQATNSVKQKRTTRVAPVRHRTVTPKRRAGGAYQIGRASWYGKYFHGRKTASGEKYDMFQFTAAHQQLPLGTHVKVTNLENGRWVVVKVNDRGPVPRSRIIDLSYGAAQILHMRASGIQRVRLDIVEPQTVAQATTNETDIAGLQ